MTETALAAAPARPMHPTVSGKLPALDAVSVEAWTNLVAAAVEPNAFFDPAYALPVSRFARGAGKTVALMAHADGRLTGLLPVKTAFSAYRLPVPALVSHQPYTVLGSPLLVTDQAELAAEGLLDAAARSGAHVLALHMADLDGPALAALSSVAARRELTITTHEEHERAALSVPDDAETYLRSGMGSKKLKELRRQRHRLEEEGAVAFRLADDAASIRPALQRFLELEAAGWKGRRGTGLGQHEGDTRYITEAALGMASQGGCEILELTLGGQTIAAGVVLRQQHTAMFFKIAFDEAYARFSPGVQLTVELTRRMADDRSVRFVDSCALPGHPMIDHVWRERRRIGEVLITTRPGPIAAATVRALLTRNRLREAAKSLLHKSRTVLKTREKSK